MKTKETAKKMAYIGAGAGLVLFAIVGLLPGSFLGGVVGLHIAGSLFGLPVTATVVSRMIVGMSMLIGVLIAGVIFICGSAIVGWLMGYVVDSLKAGKAAPVEVKAGK